MKVEKVVIPLLEEDQIGLVCDSQLNFIGEECIWCRNFSLLDLGWSNTTADLRPADMQGKTWRYRKICSCKVSDFSSIVGKG